MKVLKFGGTSVGTPDSLRRVKEIVEAQTDKVIVVVSALGGITDQLIATARKAEAGDTAYRTMYEDMAARHRQMIDEMVTDKIVYETLKLMLDAHLEELRSIYQGVFLIHDLSPKTMAAIVSYGERISSRIVAAVIAGAEWFDSRDFIKTSRKAGRDTLEAELTHNLIRRVWKHIPQISVAGGFISTDVESGEVTNLGRGGSDYTASLIAASLGASALEIWTDVDGFMSADPRVIPNAYVINELTYAEATELCNFGAKVVYPPTIYPVCVENIPIYIKNTFNPGAQGSVIKQSAAHDNRTIKGISSINHTTVITISGLSMVGVIGVNRRIFSCLAEHGVSVFLVAQASSENSTSIGVSEGDADHACAVLDEEFAKEIACGAMYRVTKAAGLATIAVVGQNMRHTPGVAGKLFGALGRSGISVVACAQGASEMNISFVINSRYLRKALNVIHDSFFLSQHQVLNLFIAGVGTVGGSLIAQIASQRETLMKEMGLKLNVVGIASSKRAIFCREGICLDDYKAQLAQASESDIHRLHNEIVGMNIFNSVFVDCTASPEVAGLYQGFLNHNIHVVTANKIAASGDLANYHALKKTANERGVKFLFETNVGAGLPVIRTINDLCHSGDKILRIEAVLSGTLNFIFNTLSRDIPLSQAVRMAKDEGFSEPDPRIDLSGRDVMRKLVILSREAGYDISQEDVEANLFIPQELFEGSVNDFWQALPQLDETFEARRKQIEAEGRVWRFVARLEEGKASVSLCEFDPCHPFYTLEGCNNVIMLTTERYKQHPMLIQGYGAGAAVTAAGVFADIMSLG